MIHGDKRSLDARPFDKRFSEKRPGAAVSDGGCGPVTPVTTQLPTRYRLLAIACGGSAGLLSWTCSFGAVLAVAYFVEFLRQGPRLLAGGAHTQAALVRYEWLIAPAGAGFLVLVGLGLAAGFTVAYVVAPELLWRRAARPAA